tara:strand:- start:187 stop:2193 length:2007 start_codon:yes stop_codon:yes gene_type:complete
VSKLKGFSKKELVDIYSKIYLSRQLDNKQLILLKQGKGFFHIGATGHEAAELAAANSLNPGEDFSYPYYREQAFCIGLGMTSRELLLSFLAKQDDPNSSGRQMPQHFGSKRLNIVSQSSPTGTQYLQAVGAAFALKRDKSNSVVYVSSGEGTTSQGDFHEALNWASREKAPVIFHIHNNHYAISVPINEQVSGESVFNITSGYESLSRFNVDGCNYFETHQAFKLAVDRARKGKGPSVIISDVVRLLPHSSSDDHTKYRSKKELENDKKRDPITLFKADCIKSKLIKENEFKDIENDIKNLVDKDADWAESQDFPNPNSYSDNLFSKVSGVENIATPMVEKSGDSCVMVDAINHALDEELKNNDKLLLYGQDIAGGKGGVFTATRGLTEKYGKNRVFNSPLAEASIIGTAIGLATLGHKPVVEIQFGDYIWTAMMQIRNELSTLRYRSNGDWSCPVVVRVPVGGYIHGSLCHSQSIDGYFTHMPGLYIAYPSNAADAKALLKTACRINDPVLFLEHKGLYRQNFASSNEPDENSFLEFGKGAYVNKGSDLTIITWGAIVQKSVEAVKKLNVSADIIDIRTLFPLDLDIIKESISKTSRVMITHEDNLTSGFGAEISAIISEHFFDMLDAPIIRVASENVPIAYSSVLENKILVQTDWIENAIERIMNF